jgi:hypothetical protein
VTWNRLQSKSAFAPSGSSLASGVLPSNVASGTKIIVLVQADTTTTSTVKDAALNSWTKIASITGGNTAELSLWAFDTPAGDVGTAPTLTATFAGASTGCAILVQEVSGLLAGNTTAMVDGTAGTENAVAGANTVSPTYSSTASGEYLIACYGDDGNTGALTWTAPGTYTADANAINSNVDANVAISYKNSTGGSESGNYTQSSNIDDKQQILVAFKLAPVIGAGQNLGPPPLMRRWIFFWRNPLYIGPGTSVPPPGQPTLDVNAVAQRRATQWRWLPPTLPVPGAPGSTPVPVTDIAAAVESPLTVTSVQESPVYPVAQALMVRLRWLPAVAVQYVQGLQSFPVQPDAAAATDATGISVSAAVPASDVGAAAETLSFTSVQESPVYPVAQRWLTKLRWLTPVLPPVSQPSLIATDVGAATDADPTGISVAGAIPLPDVGAAVESAPAITVTAPVSDVAGAAEVLATVSTQESPVYPVAQQRLVRLRWLPAIVVSSPPSVLGTPIPLGDAGAAVDDVTSTAITVTAPLGDVGGSVESLSVAAVIPQSDVAAGVETGAFSAAIPAGDAGGAVESPGIAADVPAGDVAAGADSVSGGIAVSLGASDVAGGTEALSATVAAGLGDVAGAADAISVFVPPTGPVTYWKAVPARLRWQVTITPGRWRQDAARLRWQAQPGPAQWVAVPARARWRAQLTVFDAISAGSKENINVTWTSDLDGTVVDPTVTPFVVQMAFPVSSGNINAPSQPSTWYTGAWLAGGTGKGFVAQVIVGPGGGLVTLAAGKYDVWSQITGTSENPRKFVGVLTVY